MSMVRAETMPRGHLSFCGVIVRADCQANGHFLAWEPRGRWIHDPTWHVGIRLKVYAADFVEIARNRLRRLR
jgi:hypothetical protein